MPISSLIVTTREGCAESVAQTLKAMDMVSVTDIHGNELILVTETETRQEDKQIWDDVETTDGVKSVSLIYHNFEDLEEKAS